MKSRKTRLMVCFGVFCALLLAGASWYSLACNGGRLVYPMDFSTYTFRPQDLPMLIACGLVILYVLSLAVLLVRCVLANRRRQADASTARAINPKFGFLGFLGFVPTAAIMA